LGVAASCKALGLLKEAQEELNQAHQILVSNLGWGHPKVAVVVGTLATLAEVVCRLPHAHQQLAWPVLASLLCSRGFYSFFCPPLPLLLLLSLCF
jgi:hypothetical protein